MAFAAEGTEAYVGAYPEEGARAWHGHAHYSYREERADMMVCLHAARFTSMA